MVTVRSVANNGKFCRFNASVVTAGGRIGQWRAERHVAGARRRQAMMTGGRTMLWHVLGVESAQTM